MANQMIIRGAVSVSTAGPLEESIEINHCFGMPHDQSRFASVADIRRETLTDLQRQIFNCAADLMQADKFSHAAAQFVLGYARPPSAYRFYLSCADRAEILVDLTAPRDAVRATVVL